MSCLYSRFLGFLSNGAFLKKGETALIGLSGGIDSVTLLHLAKQAADEIGFNVAACHYNHNIRKTAQRDADFCRELAGELGIEYIEGKRKGRPLLKKRQGLEGHLRELRYRFFQKAYEKTGAKCILLAHHLDDQAETMLMRLFRGSGVDGLKGIARDTFLNGMRVVRPLLDIPKKEIVKYARMKKIPFCTDETNLETDRLRNKIRIELLPLIERGYCPDIKEKLARAAFLLSEEMAFLDAFLDEAFLKSFIHCWPNRLLIKRKSLYNIPQVVVRRLFRKAVEYIAGEKTKIEYRHSVKFIELLENAPEGSELHLPHRITVKKKRAWVEFLRKEEETDAR